MAGGMDWFRWHHGSVNDQKFQLVAKRCGASVGEVLALWACLLESASTNEPRGYHGQLDFEAMDCALGYADGKCSLIYERMREREMIDADGRICAWEKRQPKREREDDSTPRVKAFRERHETPGNATKRQGTPDATKKRQETPRREESREEKNHSVPSGTDAAGVKTPEEIIFGYGVPLLVSAGSSDKHARSFLGGMRKEHGDSALIDSLRQCFKAKPLQPLEWLAAALPPKGTGPPRGKQSAIEARNAETVKRLLADDHAPQ